MEKNVYMRLTFSDWRQNDRFMSAFPQKKTVRANQYNVISSKLANNAYNAESNYSLSIRHYLKVIGNKHNDGKMDSNQE